MNANKLLIAMTALVMLIFPAHAQSLPDTVYSVIPPNASTVNEESAGFYRVLTFQLETDEQLELIWDTQNNAPVSLVTIIPASSSANDPQQRSTAELLIQSAYPGASILFAQDVSGGAKELGVIHEYLYGTICISGDAIVSRNLHFGSYARGGHLTMEGAFAALKLHRPEAEFRALELDEDGGVFIYEGEAMSNGEVFEFELDAVTGRLLEWERD